MANEVSIIDTDELFGSIMMCSEYCKNELVINEILRDEEIFDSIQSPVMSNSEIEGGQSMSTNEYPIDEDFDLFPDNQFPLLTSFEEQNLPFIDIIYPEPMTLSFINPPDSYYHVRYVSEITDGPLNGSLIDTRMKTKKNISGRYLRGLRRRYVTIELPKFLSSYSHLYVRVTRLTVPYQFISFIHPYPIFYSSKKKKSHSHVISKDSSIYFKVTKDEILSCSKQFPNIILTRQKQCDLNKMKELHPFDNSGTSHPFTGANAKEKITRYNLKQSIMDFGLVHLCEETGEFIDTGICCQSVALLEAEGVKWRRSMS